MFLPAWGIAEKSLTLRNKEGYLLQQLDIATREERHACMVGWFVCSYMLIHRALDLIAGGLAGWRLGY